MGRERAMGHRVGEDALAAGLSRQARPPDALRSLVEPAGGAPGVDRISFAGVLRRLDEIRSRSRGLALSHVREEFGEHGSGRASARRAR
jgi:hypothetical protein